MAAVADINALGKYELNPRGNLWLKEKNKFGERLMKKMGWSQGKGLGKNENGIQENIKVRLKNNNSGVGWKNKSIDIGNGEYDSLLNDLWKNYAPKEGHDNESSDSGASLENRSQKFKNRLHYRKFVLGKDISHYSEKDMRSIFVTKPKEEVKSCAQEDVPVQETMILNGFQDKLKKNVLSVVDYFNQKLKHKKIDGNEKNEAFADSVVEATAESTTSSLSENIQETECLLEGNATTKTSKRRKKSKSMKVPNENDKMASDCSSFAALNNASEISETDCKSEEYRIEKRKRKALIATVETDLVDSENLKLSPESSPTKKSKRRKKSKTEQIEETSPSNMSNNSSDSSIDDALNNDVKLKNKKRKKHVELYTKAKKMKGEAISTMKSCLKNNILKNSLKRQVSFNKDISFRTFDSESAVDSMDEEQVSCIKSPEMDGGLINENIDNKTNLEINGKLEKTLNDPQSVEGTVKETQTNFEPKPISPIKRPSVYNSWLESQRLALKMKAYKNMYQSIKDHCILQSTNLAQIKGYGNWGY